MHNTKGYITFKLLLYLILLLALFVKSLEKSLLNILKYVYNIKGIIIKNIYIYIYINNKKIFVIIFF